MTFEEVRAGIKEKLQEELVPYEWCRELVFLIASNDNPSIKEVSRYLKIAKEVRSNFWDYYKRKEQV
tara:strand:- start:55 stop:255 length:201 start_codon:yes stop_codon:yes gene_type:complete